MLKMWRNFDFQFLSERIFEISSCLLKDPQYMQKFLEIDHFELSLL